MNEETCNEIRLFYGGASRRIVAPIWMDRSPEPKKRMSHVLDFLDQLIGEQADARRERSVQRRIREAHFAENKSLEGFHWKFNPSTAGRSKSWLPEISSGAE